MAFKQQWLGGVEVVSVQDEIFGVGLPGFHVFPIGCDDVKDCHVIKWRDQGVTLGFCTDGEQVVVGIGLDDVEVGIHARHVIMVALVVP